MGQRPWRWLDPAAAAPELLLLLLLLLVILVAPAKQGSRAGHRRSSPAPARGDKEGQLGVGKDMASLWRQLGLQGAAAAAGGGGGGSCRRVHGADATGIVKARPTCGQRGAARGACEQRGPPCPLAQRRGGEALSLCELHGACKSNSGTRRAASRLGCRIAPLAAQNPPSPWAPISDFRSFCLRPCCIGPSAGPWRGAGRRSPRAPVPPAPCRRRTVPVRLRIKPCHRPHLVSRQPHHPDAAAAALP